MKTKEEVRGMLEIFKEVKKINGEQIQSRNISVAIRVLKWVLEEESG